MKVLALSFTFTGSASDYSALKTVSRFFNFFKINRKVMSAVIKVDFLPHFDAQFKELSKFFEFFLHLCSKLCSRSAANLGLIFDSSLKWTEHIY